MYVSYAHDNQAQAEEIAARAVEGPTYHLKNYIGTISVNCTANVDASVNVAFPNSYKSGTTPVVLYSLLTVGDHTSTIKYTDLSSISASGFTINVQTDKTQTLAFTWLSYGDVS